MSEPRPNIGDAGQLRTRQTSTEAALWELLRDRRLNGHKVRRQHPIGNFVVDFYCAHVRLIIEIDGGIHTARQSVIRDHSRQRTLEKLGYRFLRVPAALIETDSFAALEVIRRAIENS